MLRVGFFKNKIFFLTLLGTLGVALLTFGCLAAWDYVTTTRVGDEYPSTETITTTTVVSERPVQVNDNVYTVPGDQPRVIQIPAISVDAYMQRVGVDQHGAMATPSNINFVGWYVSSPVPGEQGVSIINGHVGGRYSDGVFKHLKDLKQDDRIKIQMGNLSWREFSVVSTASYPVTEAAQPLFEKNPLIDKELHLITCEGEFDDAAQTYDQRTIVVAKYIE